MIVFEKRKRVYIYIFVLIIAIAAATVIEHFEGETFTEEVMTRATDETAAQGAGINKDGKININTASKEELALLYGVGEKIALRIVEYRERHGAFSQIEGIMLVPGVGEMMFESIRDSICIE